MSSEEFRGAAAGADITIGYIVEDGPRGAEAWRLRLSAEGPEVDLDPAGRVEAADVTIEMTWDAARRLASGGATMRQVEAEGDLSITGDVAAFFRHSAAITCFDQLVADLDIVFD